jgi:DNA-binding MarR family transcriptional regulator
VAKTKLLLDEFLPYRLSVASNAVSQAIAHAYERAHGLSMQEWRVIAVVAEGGDLTQRDIVERTKMDKVTVSRAARSLEERELIRRAQNADDARSLRLSLTAAGRKVYVDVVPAALELEREVFRDLSARDLSALRDLLRRVELAAEHALERHADE